MKEKIMFLVIGMVIMLLLGAMTDQFHPKDNNNKCETMAAYWRQNFKNYEIVCDPNIDNVQKKVEKKLGEGWHPIGGISIADSNSFYQAMIK